MTLLAALAACVDPQPQGTGSTPVVALDEGPGVTCANPAAREAAPYTQLALPAEPDRPYWYEGVGLAVADLDGDDQLDLVVTGKTDTFGFRGVGDGFEPVDWFPGVIPESAGATVADYDGDADLDVLLTRYLASNVLLQNDGDGGFTDVTAAAGLSNEPRRSVPASWADYDRDGDLDLWIGGYGYIDETDGDPYHTAFDPAEPDWLYVNRGDGTFEDRSDLLPAEVHDGYALGGGWEDVDGDGWLDLYPVFDFGASFPNHLLWNRAGTLVSDGGVAGLDIAQTGMGLGAGDVNGDGLDDFVIPAWDGNSLLVSGASGKAWFDYAAQRGPQNDLERKQKIAWGGELADLDDDGDLDSVMTYGFLDARYPSAVDQPDAVYLQGADGGFVDGAPALGLDQGTVGRGSVVTDLNGDGWLDLLRIDLAGPLLVDRAACGEGAWLSVSLRQPGGNRFAVGAHVVALTDARRVAGTVRAGGTGYASSGPPVVHLGLGDADVVDLAVRWPDGRTTLHPGLDTRRAITLTRE